MLLHSYWYFLTNHTLALPPRDLQHLFACYLFLSHNQFLKIKPNSENVWTCTAESALADPPSIDRTASKTYASQ